MTEAYQENMISGDTAGNEARFRFLFDRCDDVVFRSLTLGSGQAGLLIFIEGMVNEQRMELQLLQPLLSCHRPGEEWGNDKLAWLIGSVLPTEKISMVMMEDQAVQAIMDGDVMLLVDEVPGSLLVSMSSTETRAIEEPPSEPVIRGPRDGFTESLQINTTLIRRRLRTPRLKSESFQAGSLSRTKLMLMYVEGIAREELIHEVKARIGNIRLEIVLESGYIEEMMADNRHSIFPQMMPTERPDRASAALAEGKVVILVDNTPFVLCAPATSFEMLQAAEDYSQNYMIVAATRWLRLILSLLALIFPSIYIAITTMHQEMLPADLLLSIASSREAVPFPAIVEAIIMELAFEALREAGVRLPRQVGQAVSIVGALVIGQAAVQAGLVSSSLVIVVSFTGIASFIIPSYSQGLAIRYLRFPCMVAAGLLGLYGVFIFLLALLVHMSKLKSFGVPYLAPVSSMNMKGVKDVFLRVPWWSRGGSGKKGA